MAIDGTNFERGSVTGSDARRKRNSAEPVGDTRRQAGTPAAVIPPLKGALMVSRNMA